MNLFFFDETMISDSVCKQACMGLPPKSGVGNVNIYCMRGKALGFFIPFSRYNSSTSFSLFVSKVGFSENAVAIKRQHKPFAKGDTSSNIRSVCHPVILGMLQFLC